MQILEIREQKTEIILDGNAVASKNLKQQKPANISANTWNATNANAQNPQRTRPDISTLAVTETRR